MFVLFFPILFQSRISYFFPIFSRKNAKKYRKIEKFLCFLYFPIIFLFFLGKIGKKWEILLWKRIGKNRQNVGK